MRLSLFHFFSQTLLFLLLPSCQQEISYSPHLSKKVIKKIYPAIVEVVVPKIEDPNIIYARPLPFERQDFHIRNDKYHPIGTAFFISKKRLASAAHVFGLDSFTLWKKYYVRDYQGHVHKVGKIIKYSQYRDYIEFELKSYPSPTHTLSSSQKVEIGDMVYAVGNAQGEGISTRGGQVSSFTPEHINGLWKFIRFSSPASPGNSGGPLVNSKGEAVGVVVMKNNSENLNFALPIQELKNISSKKAEFFNRGLKIQDGTQVVTRDWKESASLPSNLTLLRDKAIPSKDRFYQKLIREFKKNYLGQAFPMHPRFRDYLRSQRSPVYTGQVNKDPNLNQWTVDFTDFKKMIIAEDQALYHGKGEIFSHEVLVETPKGKNIDHQIRDEEALIKTIVKGLGANRVVAGQKIPIYNYGKPNETHQWRDRLGRPWFSHFWYIHYNNTFMAVHTTPTPKGVLSYVDINWAGAKNEGYMALVKENILELPLSYSGNPQQWKDFLSLSPSYLPTLFNEISFKISPKGLQLNSREYVADIMGLTLGEDSEIIARMGYDPTKALALKILAWEVHERKARKTGVLIGQFYEPSVFSHDVHRERWSEMLNKEGRFNGKIQNSHGLHTLRKTLSPQIPTPFWSGKGPKSITSTFVASCFSEHSRGRNWPKKICSHIQRSFRLKKTFH